MKLTWYDRIFKPKKYTLSDGKVVFQKRSRVPLILLAIAIFSYISIQVTGANITAIIKRGNQFWAILTEMVPPNWNYTQRIIPPVLSTIQMSLFGSLLGMLVSIPIAILAASNITPNVFINNIVKLFLSVTRTLPTLVTALIATFIFGLGTMAGTVAIFIFTFSYIGKLMYENIENIDMGPFEAMESMGLTKIEAFRYAVVPQVLPTFLSISLYNFEGNIRHASILGYVGAGGIGLLLDEQLGWRTYANVGMILFVLMIVVFIIEQISEHFRAKLT